MTLGPRNPNRFRVDILISVEFDRAGAALDFIRLIKSNSQDYIAPFWDTAKINASKVAAMLDTNYYYSVAAKDGESFSAQIDLALGRVQKEIDVNENR